MRLMHTADWHLGRILHGVHLTEDQEHVLDQFVALVQDSQVDAVLIAGDVTALYPKRWSFESLARLVRGLKVPVWSSLATMIVRRIGLPAALEDQGLHVVGAVPPRCIVIPSALKYTLRPPLRRAGGSSALPGEPGTATTHNSHAPC
jgi:exonuclease SbcD